MSYNHLTLLRAHHADNALYNKSHSRAVVVAHLVERLLPIPEVHSSNPVIGKNLSEQNGVSVRSELTPF